VRNRDYASAYFFGEEIASTCAFIILALYSNVYVCSSLLDIKEEVYHAIINKRAVVALESTIITHGMPHPENLKTAVEVENIVREQVGEEINDL
jgi:Indigoidine synthase A like protein